MSPTKTLARPRVVEAAIPPEVDDAIAWKVLLDSGEATEADRRALEGWMRSSPANETAWFDLSASLSPFGAARRLPMRRGTFAEAAMKRAVGRRNVVLGLGGLALIGAAGAVVTDRYVPLDGLTADHITGTGGRKDVKLADGSDVVLGARTAVDLDFAADRRLINLREGEALLRGRAAEVPLTARAGVLTLQADSGTFVMRHRNGRTSVAAIDKPARVASPGYQTLMLAPGRAVWHEGNRVFERAAELQRETSWVNGLLVVDDHDLDSVVAALRPYFAGVIRVDPAVASMRVTGVYPLSDPSKAIDLLARTLSLSVTRRTPFWISVGPQSSDQINT